MIPGAREGAFFTMRLSTRTGTIRKGPTRPFYWILFFVTLLAVTAAIYWVLRTRRAHVAALPPNQFPEVPSLKWRKQLPDPITGAPALDKDGSLYVPTFGGVYALDKSGGQQWVYRVDLHDIASGLLLDDQNNLYFSTLSKVFSITSSGRKRWEIQCSPPKAFAQEVQGAALGVGVLYATCGETLSAVGAIDGRKLWDTPTFEFESAPAVLANGATVFPRGQHLVAVGSTGQALWNNPPLPVPGTRMDMTSVPYFQTPIAVGADGTLYLGARNGPFSAFSPDGVEKWKFDLGPAAIIQFDSSPVIASDNTVIVVTTAGTIYRFSQDGTVLWNLALGDPRRVFVRAAPLLGYDGVIYVVVGPELAALSLDGSVLWKLALPHGSYPPILTAASPTLATDGTLYIATNDGVIYAVQTASKGLMESPWPKYQRDVSNSGRAMAPGSLPTE